MAHFTHFTTHFTHILLTLNGTFYSLVIYLEWHILILKSISNEEVSQDNKEACDDDAKNIERKYKKLLDEDFKENDHIGDPRATHLSPKSGQQYSPFPKKENQQTPVNFRFTYR